MADAAARRCAGSGTTRGCSRSTPRPLEMTVAAAATATRRGVIAAYDDAVAALCPALARRGSRARIRLARGRDRRARRPGAPASARRARADAAAPRPSGSTATGTSCSTRAPSPAAIWGPEGRPGWRGSTPRCCGSAGSPATPPAAGRPGRGVARGRAAVRASSATSTSSPRSGPSWPRCCAPPATPPAARELGDRARETAHRLGAQPLLDELRALGSAPAAAARPAATTLTAARARDPGPGRRGPQQRRDRQAAVHLHQDGLGPRLQHPGKLGAAGRTEAAAIARRRGLLD